MFDNAKANEAQNMAISEEDKQRELKEQEAEQQKILIFTAIAFLVLAIGIYLNGKRKQKNKIKKNERFKINSETTTICRWYYDPFSIWMFIAS